MAEQFNYKCVCFITITALFCKSSSFSVSESQNYKHARIRENVVMMADICFISLNISQFSLQDHDDDDYMIT